MSLYTMPVVVSRIFGDHLRYHCYAVYGDKERGVMEDGKGVRMINYRVVRAC